MPAQSNRGIWHPFPACEPKTSGVRKISYADNWKGYLYWCAKDRKWFSPNGVEVRNPQHIISFASLSR